MRNGRRRLQACCADEALRAHARAHHSLTQPGTRGRRQCSPVTACGMLCITQGSTRSQGHRTHQKQLPREGCCVLDLKQVGRCSQHKPPGAPHPTPCWPAQVQESHQVSLVSSCAAHTERCSVRLQCAKSIGPSEHVAGDAYPIPDQALAWPDQNNGVPACKLCTATAVHKARAWCTAREALPGHKA